MLNFPFSAALLAGGQSRRMGQDKAGLIISGMPLWERQIQVLKQLKPAQLFICGRADGPYIGREYDVISDEVPGAGPLSGLVTALKYASTDTLLLLAVDLPAMEAQFLGKLLHRAHVNSRSVVAMNRGELEPLAAVYRSDCLPFAEQKLRAGRRAMRSLVDELLQHQLVEMYPLTDAETGLFQNMNTPADLARFREELRDPNAEARKKFEA